MKISSPQVVVRLVEVTRLLMSLVFRIKGKPRTVPVATSVHVRDLSIFVDRGSHDLFGAIESKYSLTN